MRFLPGLQEIPPGTLQQTRESSKSFFFEIPVGINSKVPPGIYSRFFVNVSFRMISEVSLGFPKGIVGKMESRKTLFQTPKEITCKLEEFLKKLLMEFLKIFQRSFIRNF